MVFIKKLVVTLLAMGGIFIDNLTPLRKMSYLIFILLIVLYNWLGRIISGEMAIMIFSINFLIRYLFLFNSFKKNGIASRLKNLYGEIRGFEYYQFITATMFFLSALNFTLLLNKTSLYNFEQISNLKIILITLGSFGIITGFLINIWSAMLIGIDVYYYKDLFLGRPVCGIIKKGPYKYLSNPMYGVGQINSYGSALMCASAAGLFVIIMNQMMMFIFFCNVEKPHIIKYFKDNNTVSMPRV
jgi:hypothetical protein